MKGKLFKATGTIIGAVLLSTLGIYASDTLQGIDRGNLANVRDANGCGANAVPFTVDGRVLCVDMYESSPSEKCPYSVLTNVLQSEQNASTKECIAVSVKDVQPWNYISLPQAQRMCSASGKRLPTNKEWYHIALGTNASDCSVSETSQVPTGREGCISTAGVYDAVGNVWEWIDETVVNRSYEGRDLPEEGYVTSVDAKGIAVTSGQSPDELYGTDYFWSQDEGVFGMIRGGFYGSGEDAGLYTTNAAVPTSFAAQGVGFRCVEDLL